MRYLSFTATHTTLKIPEKYYNLYKNIDPSLISESETIKMSRKDINDAKKIYGMITNIDDNIGKLITKLKELEIDDNTILIFLTDNGPQQLRFNSNLKGRKGKVYNGGIKVPFYLNYPKIHENGSISAPMARQKLSMSEIPIARRAEAIGRGPGAWKEAPDLKNGVGGMAKPFK
mgnify:CR=1 FL=1